MKRAPVNSFRSCLTHFLADAVLVLALRHRRVHRRGSRAHGPREPARLGLGQCLVVPAGTRRGHRNRGRASPARPRLPSRRSSRGCGPGRGAHVHGHVRATLADTNLFYDAPLWLFTVAYTLFGLLVAAAWWRSRRGPGSVEVAAWPRMRPAVHGLRRRARPRSRPDVACCYVRATRAIKEMDMNRVSTAGTGKRHSRQGRPALAACTTVRRRLLVVMWPVTGSAADEGNTAQQEVFAAEQGSRGAWPTAASSASPASSRTMRSFSARGTRNVAKPRSSAPSRRSSRERRRRSRGSRTRSSPGVG